MFWVNVLPHERSEAIDVWRDRLTPEQIAAIENAPETAKIKMYSFGWGGVELTITSSSCLKVTPETKL